MKKTRKKNWILFILFFSILLIIYFSLYYIYINYVVPESNSQYEAMQIQNTEDSITIEETLSSSDSISDMIEHVSKSVVGISKFQNKSNSIFSNSSGSEVGTGTGVIVSKNGYILSNSHVTGEKYSTCYVTLENGDTYTAKVVWSDIDLDLAICKIDASELVFAELGDSDSVKARQFCFCNW